MLNMQTQSLFGYADYKSYVNHRLESSQTRGQRSALARTLGCQSAYVSAVLRGSADFTPEQGEGINQFFGHNETEADFFLLLLQWQRAGTESLRQRLFHQLEKIRRLRFHLAKRLRPSLQLAAEDQATYYSEWYYSAIHALASLPDHGDITGLAERLGLESTLVGEAVDFLLKAGILSREKGRLAVGRAQIHLSVDSPWISKHHMNWRLQAMQSLASRNREDLHYSSVISVSKEDCLHLKEKIIALIKSSKSVIRESKEETVACFNVDFFGI